MWTKEQMDERALWIRGNVFLHSFIWAMLVLAINMFVQDFYGHWAHGRYESLLMLVFLIAVTSVELIVREVYIVQPRVQVLSIVMMTVAAAALLVGNALDLAHGDALVEGGMLTNTGASLFTGLLFMVMPVTLALRTLAGRLRPAAGDEDSE